MPKTRVSCLGMVQATNEELQRSYPGLARFRWSPDQGCVPGIDAKPEDFMKYKTVLDKVLLNYEYDRSLDAAP